MQIQESTADELAEVASIIDGAALQIDIDYLAPAIRTGNVLVATRPDGPILGAVVLEGTEIRAIAVRPGRRGQGIGTELVEAAAARREELLARFVPAVRSFWESVGFVVTETETNRLQGVRR